MKTTYSLLNHQFKSIQQTVNNMELQDNPIEDINFFPVVIKRKQAYFPFFSQVEKSSWRERAGSLQKRCGKGQGEESGPAHMAGHTGTRGWILMGNLLGTPGLHGAPHLVATY